MKKTRELPTLPDSYYGFIYHPSYFLNTKDLVYIKDLVYAEITVGDPDWRHFWQRWWFEIHSIGEPDQNGITGMYWHQYDGGGVTLRQCLKRASKAVEQALEELESGS